MTFIGRAFTSGLFHLVAINLPIGTTPNTVWTQPDTRFPPVLPDAHDSPLQVTATLLSVEGGNTSGPKAGVYACNISFTHASGRGTVFRWHCYTWKATTKPS